MTTKEKVNSKNTSQKNSKSNKITKNNYHKLSIFQKLKHNFSIITKSQKIFILLALLIIIFLTIFIVVNLGVKIRFLVSDELQINLNPLQTIINTNNNQENITFDISVNNFRFCKAQCDYKITDTYTNKIIYQNSTNLKFNKNIKETFIFQKDIPKFGQEIYYFEINCHNIKTFICKTQELPRYRSSLITINFDYDNKTKNILDNNKNLLLIKQNNILTSIQNQNKIIYLINEINQTIKTNKFFEKKDYYYEFQTSINNYYNQNFEESTNELNDITINSFEKDLFQLKLDLFSYNNNIQTMNFSYNNIFNNIFDFYKKTNTNKAEEITWLYQNINSNSNSFEEIIGIKNITRINSQLLELNSSYVEDKINFENDFKSNLNINTILLQKIYPSIIIDNSSICNYANNLSKIIINHNDNKQNITDVTLISTINFIQNNLFYIEENSTHFYYTNVVDDNSAPTSILKSDATKSFKDYSIYLRIPNINLSYCNITYSLFVPKTFNKIIYDENFTSLTNTNDFELIQINNPYKFSCIYNNCSIMPEKNPHPILFIHGHSFNKDNPPESSISAFYDIRKTLGEDKLIINGGDIDYSSANNGYWANSNIPLGISATYFYITYYDINFFAQSIKKEEGIEVYSIRLKELIDTTLSQTNSDKVILVTHSMGGLIARNYLKLFGEDKVDKLILISVPNNGVEGTLDKLCSYFGEKKACEDLSKNSVFLKKLSTYNPKIPIYNIIGQGCSNGGDGAVKLESAKLPYNTSKFNYTEFFINGTCVDVLGVSFHSDILDTKKYPQTYNILKEILFN
jgi:pimeloyl-ACP methyl ester carboxylesterase